MTVKEQFQKEIEKTMESAERIREMAEDIKKTPKDKHEELKKEVDTRIKEIQEHVDKAQADEEGFLDKLKNALVFFLNDDVYEGHEIADKIIEMMDELRRIPRDETDKDSQKFLDDSNKFD